MDIGTVFLPSTPAIRPLEYARARMRIRRQRVHAT